jgi:phosphoribosylformimino-5-aminoimidazole carboxamide ribotide isomerase
MRIVPVIDLMGGQAVHARRGDRASYAPIRSALLTGSAPVDVAAALLGAAAQAQARLADAPAAGHVAEHAEPHTAAQAGADRAAPASSGALLYIADLDALQGGACQAGLLRDILLAQPGLTIWLDAGFASAAAARALIDCLGPLGERVCPIYASEALADVAALADCCGGAAGRSAMLSLDQRGSDKLDPAGCWTRPDLWPHDLIVMTLERVGAASGPALDVLDEVARRARSAGRAVRLWGAGGVRDLADLRQAQAAGASGWLIATALHEGRLV